MIPTVSVSDLVGSANQNSEEQVKHQKAPVEVAEVVIDAPKPVDALPPMVNSRQGYDNQSSSHRRTIVHTMKTLDPWAVLASMALALYPEVQFQAALSRPARR